MSNILVGQFVLFPCQEGNGTPQVLGRGGTFRTIQRYVEVELLCPLQEKPSQIVVTKNVN